MHVRRLRRNGTTDPAGLKFMQGYPEAERFWAKVHKTDTCWMWTGYRLPGGYGQFKLANRRTTLAHRWAYIALVGPIPDGYELDHLCVNPACVRPDHLEAVTATVNMSRQGSRRTHCVHGHPFTDANTYVTTKGYRACRACHNARGREAKRAARAAARAAR